MELKINPNTYRIPYLIDGEIRQWDGSFQQVDSPVLIREGGSLRRYPLGGYPNLSEKEAHAALEAAVRAYDNGNGAWPSASVQDRIAAVEQFISKVREKRAEVVRLLMWEICKTTADAEKEFDRTMEYVEATIEELKEIDRGSATFLMDGGFAGQSRRSPLGVVLCMGPFNYPLNETWTTLIPALIMGNCIIVKPPRFGVLLHGPFLEAFRDCFPKGVVNFITGDGPTLITPIMKSGKVSVLAFIGTSRVADLIRQQHPHPHRLRSVLGLEAKNPAIVLPDARIDEAVRELMLGALSYNGQRCTAIKIIFVHESIGPEFLDAFAKAVDGLKPGLPWESGAKITPLAEPGKPAWLDELVREAEGLGARIVNQNGGARDETFYFPSIVHPSRPEMRIHHVEQFGPLIPVAFFREVSECLDYVSASPYGQQASVYGNDPGQLGRIIDSLANQISRININSECRRGPDSFPFTGRKDSAEGTLSVHDALRSFSIRALVAAELDAPNRELLTQIVRGRHSRFLSTDFLF